MLVEDSAMVRLLFRQILEADSAIAVVAAASNGQAAIDMAKQVDVDVIVLDIEMPVMDGLTALPQLLAVRPKAKVLVATALNAREADIAMRALVAGAAECIGKPAGENRYVPAEFARDFVAKVKALGEAAREARRGAAPGEPPSFATHRARTSASLRLPPLVLALGASTGGPAALLRLLAALKGHVQQPIFVTQHMPVGFTALLAQHLGNASGRPAAEAAEGEPVRDGRIYLAPGNWHLTVESGSPRRIRLLQTPPENYCRPAVDPMLRSLAATYGNRLLCVILTGMGHDGLAGATQVVASGGTVIAQDEKSSVVWGMPGAVATAGLCRAILPLDDIAPFVERATRCAA